MFSQNETIRRVVLWAALLTMGVALVGMQFGCDRPSTLSAPGFRHASRQARPDELVPSGAAAQAPEASAKQVKFEILWIEPRKVLAAGKPGKAASDLSEPASKVEDPPLALASAGLAK